MKLGLPSREYYLGKGNTKYLGAYRRFMTDVAVRLGADEKYAEQEMEEVLKLETRLANVSPFSFDPAH
jgi:membrane metallo-endopeptidase-like protein 1